MNSTKVNAIHPKGNTTSTSVAPKFQQYYQKDNELKFVKNSDKVSDTGGVNALAILGIGVVVLLAVKSL